MQWSWGESTERNTWENRPNLTSQELRGNLDSNKKTVAVEAFLPGHIPAGKGKISKEGIETGGTEPRQRGSSLYRKEHGESS